MANRFSENAYITGVASSGITGNVKTAVFNLDGFESACAIAIASASNSSNHLAMRMGTASASAGLSDATGHVAHTTSGALVLDVFRPVKQFVQFRYSASGATGAAVAIAAFAYGARSVPTTQPAETVVTRLYSPGSGTASA